MSIWYVSRVTGTAHFAAVRLTPVVLTELENRLTQFNSVSSLVSDLEVMRFQNPRGVSVLSARDLAKIWDVLGSYVLDDYEPLFVQEDLLPDMNVCSQSAATLDAGWNYVSWSVLYGDTGMLLREHIKVAQIISSDAQHVSQLFGELIDINASMAAEAITVGVGLPGNVPSRAVAPLLSRDDVAGLLESDDPHAREKAISSLSLIGKRGSEAQPRLTRFPGR